LVTSKAQEYKAKTYSLSGLTGISDRTLELHFKLYQGYVKNTNLLNERIQEILTEGHVKQEDNPAYSELTRRLGFEYNGMVLHEYYFGNMKRQAAGEPGSGSPFRRAVEASFGTYETWKLDFVSTGELRGVGWAICYRDPVNGRISNHWISLHQEGNVAGFIPVLVMDVWEHAFLLDYAPDKRAQYIEAFFSNIDWSVVDTRVTDSAPRR